MTWWELLFELLLFSTTDDWKCVWLTQTEMVTDEEKPSSFSSHGAYLCLQNLAEITGNHIKCNIPWINLFWKHLELDSIKNQQYMTKFWSLAGILHTHICHCNSDSGDTCRWSKVQCAQSEKKCVEMLVSWQVQRSGVKNRSWMKKRYMTSTSEV